MPPLFIISPFVILCSASQGIPETKEKPKHTAFNMIVILSSLNAYKL